MEQFVFYLYHTFHIPLHYEEITWGRIVRLLLSFRLINRELYPVALEICNYLRVPPVEGEVKILRQWAVRKVGYRILRFTGVQQLNCFS